MMPTFTADDPEDVRLAEVAWAAGVECTGTVPAVSDAVSILRTLPEGTPFAGWAGWRLTTPTVIQLREAAGPEVLAHEVAHAWSHEGSLALITLDGRHDWSQIERISPSGLTSDDVFLRVPTRVLAKGETLHAAALESAALLALVNVEDARRAAAAAALVRTQFHAGALATSLGAHPYEVAPWVAAWRRCPSGWPGLLDGRCKQPEWR